MTVFYIILIALAAVTYIVQVAVVYEMHHLPQLAEVDAPDPATWPSLSVVLTACNEEDTMEEALRSLLAVDYPVLEVIAVNDRSTDGTGAIVDRLSENASNIRVVHIEELPSGWLGKLHAMHVGTEASTGDFILYCDADVHFKPACLRRALAWAVHEQLDHLSLLPAVVAKSVATAAMVQAFAGLWILGTRPSRINGDKKGGYGGTGAFNMVRRSALLKTEGWPWLKMEIADDIGLAYLLYRHGFKSRLGTAVDFLALEWYPSVGDMVAGLEKNLFAVVARFSLLRAAAICVLNVAFVLSPWLLLATPYYGVGLATFGGFAINMLTMPSMGTSWVSKMLSTQMGFLISVALLRSSYKTLRRGNVDWRGTLYSIDELRAEQRVKV